MTILRWTAVILPQVLIVLQIGARYNLIFGFNRTDTGFTTLLFLFVLTPAVTLAWLIAEIMHAVIRARRDRTPVPLLFPALAFFMFLESLLVDIYLLLGAHM